MSRRQSLRAVGTIMDRFMRRLIDSRVNPIFELDTQKERNQSGKSRGFFGIDARRGRKQLKSVRKIGDSRNVFPCVGKSREAVVSLVVVQWTGTYSGERRGRQERPSE